MKKRIAIILVITLLVSSFGFVYADTAEVLKATLAKIKVNLDGKKILDQILVVDGISYLPVKKIATLLGADVQYNQFTNEINLINNKPQTVEPCLTNAEISYIADVKYVYDNGIVYTGQIRNGTYHGGDNKITFPDGTVYEGAFANGVIEGQGKYTALNGDKFEGIFESNQYKGYGKYTYVNGDVIEGQFEGNKLVSGTYVSLKTKLSTKTQYLKSSDWKREIVGVNTYTLTFDRTKFNGTANIVFRDGTQYNGAISNNTFNGSGTIVYVDGSIYKGIWVSDQKTGKGKFTYSSNTVYDGYFLNNQYEGEGKFYYANGDLYDGTWKANKRNGRGKYTYSNGNYYDGEWLNDNKHTLNQKDDDDYLGYGEYVIDGVNNPDLSGKDIEYKQKWDNGKKIKEVLIK
jgi:hypothetical protein